MFVKNDSSKRDTILIGPFHNILKFTFGRLLTDHTHDVGEFVNSDTTIAIGIKQIENRSKILDLFFVKFVLFLKISEHEKLETD